MQWQRSNFPCSIEVEPLFHGGEKAANHLQIAATNQTTQVDRVFMLPRPAAGRVNLLH
jgi:hypothetical protein